MNNTTWTPKVNELLILIDNSEMNADIGSIARFKEELNGYWFVEWLDPAIQAYQLDGGYFPHAFGPLNFNNMSILNTIDTLKNDIKTLYLQSKLDLALLSVAANEEFNSIEEVCEYIKKQKKEDNKCQ